MDRGLIELLDIIKTYKEEGASIFNILGQLHIPSLDIDIITNDIKTLISEGLIIEKKKDVYVASEFSKVLIGTISMHKKGFGIVTCNNNNKLEIFIPPRKAKKVLHDDVVRVEIIESTKPGNRPEGEIVEIIKRGKTKYVGILTIEEGNPYGFVICDDNKIKNDIYVPVENLNNAINNQKVVCEIVKWNEKDKNPTGMIVEVLGEIGDVGIDILSIAKEFGYELDFPENVKNEANNIEEVIYKEELEGRKDLRNELIFTIDGADAKDLDDAISIKKLENGNYLLGVHIADVSHYVVENMKIDKEAVKRGTSVYLVDRVIPMLPKVLSNGICSLNPNVDRLTLSIDMEIDKNGNVIKHKIYESVINSKARMVYEDVSDILENNDEYLIEKYNLLVETFRMSEELAKILMDRRDRRGAIDFNFDEAKIILNDEGFPIDIKKYDRRIANRIIEEFMLVANETIAEHFYELDVPFVYRNHDKPDLEKVLRLEDVMNKNGLSVINNDQSIQVKKFQNACKQVKGSDIEYFISKKMLMSLKEAQYTSNLGGHFGLATDYYCHFTSPIRRYPDLQIHRIIKDCLNGRMSSNVRKKYSNKVEDVAYHSSKMERRAQEAERDVEDMKKTEYMSSKIGCEYEGIISGVISKGLFVQLDNTVEGLVRVENITDDIYIYDENEECLFGHSTNKIYNIGDKVRVKVISADTINKEINFELINLDII